MISNNILKLFLESRTLIVLFLVFSISAEAQNLNTIGNQQGNQNQNDQEEYEADFSRIDTNTYKFGIRVGVDLTGPIGALFNSERRLYKGTIDARIYKKYFLAGEYGYEFYKYNSANLNYETEGVFATIGGDLDLLGYAHPRNDIYYVGIRYGISSYRTRVNQYSIENTYWNNDKYISHIDSQNGFGHWFNLRMGLKVETLKNLYLGGSVGLNLLITASDLENFDNLYIPGFGKNRDYKAFVFNYTVMYMLPFN